MIATPEARIVAHARRIALEEALRERLEWRRWYRTTCRTMFGRRWDDLAAANTAELRALVRLLRRERTK